MQPSQQAQVSHTDFSANVVFVVQFSRDKMNADSSLIAEYRKLMKEIEQQKLVKE